MELIFPDNLRCISCDDFIGMQNPFSLCKACYTSLAKDIVVCIHCGRILGPRGICFGCEREYYHFDEVYSVLGYNDILHHMIYEFKYGQGTYMAKPFGELMLDFIKKQQLCFDYILFVPIGKKRYAQRGYNQAKLLAAEISKELNIPVIDCFRRKKNTRFMARLTGVQRKREIQGAFELTGKEGLFTLKDARVIIVDDIFTTGVTVNELSKVLRDFVDIGNISVLTLGNAKSQKSM